MLAGGTTWNGMEAVTSGHKRRTHRAILSVQYHWPTEDNFTKTYYHKELHLRRRQGVPDPTRLYIYFIYTFNSAKPLR